MKAASLRTVAVSCGLVLAAAAVGGCASRPAGHADDVLYKDLGAAFGVKGSKLGLDLGQSGPVTLVPSACFLDGNVLVLLDAENRLQVLHRDNLAIEWSYHSFPGALRYAPTQSPIAMLAMSGNELHQIDLRYGTAMGGNIRYAMAPSGPFAASAGTAYVPAWGGASGEKTLRTINLVTGFEGWGYRTPGDIRGGVIIGGNPPRQTIYFATDEGLVYGMAAAEADAQGPDKSWSVDTRGPVTAPLTLHGDDLFAASQSGFLYCLDRVTGGVKWSSPHETPLLQAAVAAVGAVYQVRDGEMWSHDRATGKVNWKLPGATRFLAEREGKAYVESAAGEVWQVGKDGKVTGKMAPSAWRFLTNTKDGTLYAVTASGGLFKVEVGGE